MRFFQGKMDCFLIVVFYVLIRSTSHCTFRSVTSSFNATLMATFDKITEEECMSKCSIVLECTFMEYNEGTCKTFKYGTEVQELKMASRAFAYSFNEDETSCPTATVSRPQTTTNMPTAVTKSIDDICAGKYKLAEWEAITATSLAEDPDNLRTCLFSPSPTELNSCTMKFLYSDLDESGWYYIIHDKDAFKHDDDFKSVRPFACADYSAESPYAVAQFACSENDNSVVVIDIEGKQNFSFPYYVGLYVYHQPFYVQKFEYA